MEFGGHSVLCRDGDLSGMEDIQSQSLATVMAGNLKISRHRYIFSHESTKNFQIAV